MSERLQQRQDKVLQMLTGLPSWEEKYKKIIELGKTLPTMNEDLKTDDVLVKGCQSRVWLQAMKQPNGEIIYHADSDALIVKGLVALVLMVYSQATTDEILATPPEYLKKLDLSQHLTPSRANGVQAFIKQVFLYAYALKSV